MEFFIAFYVLIKKLRIYRSLWIGNFLSDSVKFIFYLYLKFIINSTRQHENCQIQWNRVKRHDACQ